MRLNVIHLFCLALLFIGFIPLWADDAQPVLPADAQHIINTYQKAADDAKKSFDAAIGKARLAAPKELEKALLAATKRGDLDGANAVKVKIDEMKDGKAQEPISIVGTYHFDFHTGHQGVLTIMKGEAVEEGIHGTIAVVGATWDITWSNQTHWIISQTIDGFFVAANDGTSVLTKP